MSIIIYLTNFYEFWKLKKETMDKSEASSIVEMEKKYRIQYQQKIQSGNFRDFDQETYQKVLK